MLDTFTVEMSFEEYARYLNLVKCDFPAYQLPLVVGQTLADYAKENYDEMNEDIQNLINNCDDDVDLMEEIVLYYADENFW